MHLKNEGFKLTPDAFEALETDVQRVRRHRGAVVLSPARRELPAGFSLLAGWQSADVGTRNGAEDRPREGRRPARELRRANCGGASAGERARSALHRGPLLVSTSIILFLWLMMRPHEPTDFFASTCMFVQYPSQGEEDSRSAGGDERVRVSS